MKPSLLKATVIQLILCMSGSMLALKHILFRFDTIALGDNGDIRLNFLFLRWAFEYISGKAPHIQSILDFPIFYPLKGAIGYSDNLLGNLPLYLPFYWITQNMFVAGNLWFFACCVLKFISFNILLRYFKLFCTFHSQTLRETFIGVLSLAYTFALPVSALTPHPQTWPGFLLPLIIIFMHKAWTTQKLRHFAFLGILAAYQFWLAIQLGLMAIYWLTFAFSLGLYACIKRHQTRLSSFLLGSLLFSVVYLVSVSPLLPPYLKASQVVGSRSIDEANYFSPKFPMALYTLSANHVYHDWFPFLPHSEEQGTFIAMAWTFCLILSGFFWKQLSTHPLWKPAWISWLVIFLFTLKNSPITWIFHTLVPGFGSIRTPGRFILMSLPFAYVIIGIILERVTSQKKWLTTGILLALITIDVSGWNPRFFEFKYPSAPELALGESLKGQPTLFLPYSIDPYERLDHAMIAAVSWAPTMDAYTGWESPVLSHIKDHLSGEAQKQATEQMIKSLGIVNIIVDNSATDWLHFMSQSFPTDHPTQFENKILFQIAPNPNTTLIKALQKTPRPFLMDMSF